MSDHVSALSFFEKGDFDAALPLYQAIVDDRANRSPEDVRDACYGLGRIYQIKGEVVVSIQHFIVALKNDKTFHSAYLHLGDLFLSQGQLIPAIENYAQAVLHAPDNMVYRQKLIDTVSAKTYKKVNPGLKGMLTECLEMDALDFVFFGGAWLSFVSVDPLIAPIYKLSKHKSYDAFKRGFESLPHCNGLIEPFFLTGLGKFTVLDPAFERWCMYLRRYILEAICSSKQIFSDPEDINLMSGALLNYCFYTDYVFPVTDDERKLVEELRGRIEKADKPILAELMCLGCYIPLGELNNAKEISHSLPGGDHVSQIPKTQIEEYLEQLEIKKNIPAVTMINDDVSQKVQEQYEAFPYPRWRSCSQNLINDETEGYLKGQKAQILVAGCGTGKEAAQLAYVFPDAQIMAVDLSLVSLAYAEHRIRALGLTNIKFVHGDIMRLGEIEARFDYIASGGVLHHLKDPKAGWRVLDGLLKPGGLMRIALYSRHARWAINDARRVIEKKKISNDADSIRAFRRDISDHLKYKQIKNLEQFPDYYQLSECRDLLFHVQEHQFDLLQIKDILGDLDLEFLQFHLSLHEISKYKKFNKEDVGAIDLEGWARYEDRNKNLFASMYAFWCRKAG